uniref:Uncharacterized protein n=1 Tax=Pan troglodytes TaxID=9598 RepID=A0A2I3T330_PANTR
METTQVSTNRSTDKENVAASPSTEAPGSVVDAYEQVQKGLLKLKGVAELRVTKRKKKKKDKDKAKLPESMGMNKKNEGEKQHGLDKWTPARAAFEKMQEKRQWKGSSRKHPASKTHKQRVEDFNRHLDTLKEHYIPRVSWTK